MLIEINSPRRNGPVRGEEVRMLLGHLMVGVVGGLGAAGAALFAGYPGWMALIAYLVLGNLAWLTTLILHMAWDRTWQAIRQPARPVLRTLQPGPLQLKPVNIGR